ncbi:hypothetical protein CEXT_807791 [Caerostris extrusa]|uniref:Uncharacterized protein n=1 Tax=Caerostris extrusa TaxID=172846 RepID=A0AAV4V5Y6_CAEEX|nr:hypothetical protein CEXT_807791 [Caerostris extrusa]
MARGGGEIDFVPSTALSSTLPLRQQVTCSHPEGYRWSALRDVPHALKKKKKTAQAGDLRSFTANGQQIFNFNQEAPWRETATLDTYFSAIVSYGHPGGATLANDPIYAASCFVPESYNQVRPDGQLSNSGLWYHGLQASPGSRAPVLNVTLGKKEGKISSLFPDNGGKAMNA